MSARALVLLATLLLLPLTDGAMRPSLAAEASTARTVTLAVGASEVLRTRPGVTTIVLGNPDIADVSLINGTTLAVTGRTAGRTNLILLDASGGEIARTLLQIGSRQTQVVVFSGAKVQNYFCAPGCTAISDNTPSASAELAAMPGQAPTESAPASPAGMSTEVGGPE